MPRKRYDGGSSVFEGTASKATRRQRTRTMSIPVVVETGDAQKDGKIWLNRIARTRKKRMEMKNGEKDWRRYYEWYENEMWNDRGEVGRHLAADNARDTATVNKTGSMVNSFVPFLINGDIQFLIKPRKPSDDVSAQLQTGVLNYEWGERRMTEPVTKCVKDMVIIGHCVAKTGYTVEVDSAIDPEKSGEINYADYVRKDAPWVDRVNPVNFFFDLTARDYTLHTARWCAEVFYVPFQDVLDNSSYDPEVLRGIRDGAHTPTTRTAYDDPGSEPIWKQVYGEPLPEDHLMVLIEIWDKKYKQRMIFADGVELPLLAEPWPYDYLDNFPYAMATYIDVPNKCYGMGIYRWNEDQQNQLNRIRTAQFNHIRSHQRKFIARRDGLDDPELTKFTDGGDGTVVIADDTEAIKPVPDAQMSADFQIVEGRIVADMNEHSGADALLQGQNLPSRTTAGEIGTRARIFGLKLDTVVDHTENFVTEVAVQVLHHLKKNRTVPDVVKVVGKAGEFWQNYTSEEIQADTDVTVQSFSAPKESPESLRQQWLQVFQLTIQALPVLMQTGQAQNLDFGGLFGKVLEQFNEKDIGRFWKPGLTPMAPLVEGGEAGAAGAGAGLPPALAGMLAPGQIPQVPQGPASPAEGTSPQDLLAGLMSGGPTQ